jgi:dTDP-4-dehydrorhamnose 3,5-epimerase
MPEPVDVGIEGVRRLVLTTFRDPRGSFTEDFRREWIPGAREMVQGNVSFSRRNVLRGLHFHRDQADWWAFLTGPAVVGLFDLRDGSPTQGTGRSLAFDPSAEFEALYIPAGVAHGFYAVQDVLLHYLVDAYHTGEDEFGLAWNDPGLGIEWPTAEPILSERDRSNPSLEDVLRDPPRYRG